MRQRDKDRQAAKKIKAMSPPESGEDVAQAAKRRGVGNPNAHLADTSMARAEKHVYTRAESQAQLAMLRVLMGSRASWGDTERLIEMRKTFPSMGRLRLLKLTERLEAEMRARISAPEKNKTEFIARIRMNIDLARKAQKWLAVAQFEEMLANCEGTLIAPALNINNFNVAPALVGVVSDLPADQVDEMVAEQHALEQDARAYRALPMPATDARASVGRVTVEERVAPIAFKRRGAR